MEGEKRNDKTIQIGSQIDQLAITREKARFYGNDLVQDTQRLLDPKVCNLVHGVFRGSQGDYIFNQWLAMDEVAARETLIVEAREEPTTAKEYARWFVESLLDGDADSARNMVFSSLVKDFAPGDLYRGIEEMAREASLAPEAIKSVCKTWREMEMHAEHHLPYLPNGEQARPEVLFVEDVATDTEKEDKQIRLGEDLPEVYQNVLNKLMDVAPSEFQEQAKKLAYIFWTLDRGANLVDDAGNPLHDEVEAVASAVSELPPVIFVYLMNDLAERQKRNSRGSFTPFRTLSPNESLPKWICSRVNWRGVKDTEAPMSGVVSFYEGWTREQSNDQETTPNGTYYYYPRGICPERGNSAVDIFKAYVETDTPPGELKALFTTLGREGVHPVSTKLSEDNRLVLYWDCPLTDRLSLQIKELFKNHQVELRGFSQDSVEYVVDEDGKWESKIRMSGDQARGEGGFWGRI